MELPTLFMGMIAIAVLAIAVAQIATLWFGLRVMRRLDQIADRVEKDIQPALDRVNAVSGDVTRATVAGGRADRACRPAVRAVRRARRAVDGGGAGCRDRTGAAQRGVDSGAARGAGDVADHPARRARKVSGGRRAGGALHRLARARRGPAAAARGEGVPASVRRGFGAQPQVDDAALTAFANGGM